MKIIDISNFASKTDIKKEIYGILITTKKDFVTMVATDSYKLVKISYHISELPFFDLVEDGIYLPKSFSACIKQYNSSKKLIEKHNAVRILIGAKSTIEVDHYPQYEQAIPKEISKYGLSLIYNPIQLFDCLKTIYEIEKQFFKSVNSICIGDIKETSKTMFYSNNRGDAIVLMSLQNEHNTTIRV